MAVYQVTFTRSGRTLSCPDDKTVLECAQDAGMNLVYSCQGGTCSTCRVKVQGPIDQEEALALTQAQRDEGLALICIGKPMGDLIVDA